MRYLAPATDVHDEVDLITIPSIGKAEPAPRKSAVRETRSSRKADQGRLFARREGPVPGVPLQPGRDQTDIDPFKTARVSPCR
jgi:hypothetical protein